MAYLFASYLSFSTKTSSRFAPIGLPRWGLRSAVEARRSSASWSYCMRCRIVDSVALEHDKTDLVAEEMVLVERRHCSTSSQEGRLSSLPSRVGQACVH